MGPISTAEVHERVESIQPGIQTARPNELSAGGSMVQIAGLR